MNITKSILFLIIINSLLFAQSNKNHKLVVGIVVDQMRYDYLEKFYGDFDEGGFKRLINNGSNFTNCIINYIPTVTAAGHASIYTGTVPYYHGIITNDWKDRNTLANINACAAVSPTNKMYVEGIDKTRSPERLLTTTIGDQIKLSNYGKSKVMSISIKDRGAMMAAGKGADAAYWFDDNTGKFITSFHYMSELPDWIKDFNNSGIIEGYTKKDWKLLKHADVYSDLPGDELPYETDVFNEDKRSFPHSLKNVSQKDKYGKLTHTPWGNQILVDLAKEILKNEGLGKGSFTDHLAISFSSPDKIGHDYGPQSYEVKDTYLRLDRQLAELLNYLDGHVGNDNYILFLTADHGVMENKYHLNEMNIDAGNLDRKKFYADLISFLLERYNSNKIIKTHFARNIYLDYEVIEKLKLKREDVEESIKEYLISNVSEIAEVYTRSEMKLMSASRDTKNYILNGFNLKRSGDILFSLKANHLISERKFGSTHGSRHKYDNHIPLIFYGSSIPAERRNEQVFIEDIAPTICDLIGVNQPSDCIGVPLLKIK